MIRSVRLLLLIVSSAYSQTVTTTNPNLDHIGVKTGGVFLASNADTFDVCTTRYSCVNCTAARVCIPLADNKGFKEVQRFNCSGVTPYCDYETGSCTSAQTKQCAPQGNFMCQRDGYFPDQISCAKFHYCHNSKSYTFTCTQSYYLYDSKSESCVYNYDLATKGCYPFHCTYNHGSKVAYTLDPSIYAYCVGHTPFVVDRCPGKDELNSTSQRCKPICRKEGLIEDTEDCSSYYKCNIQSQVISTITYSMSHHTCPDGQAYSPIVFQCVGLAQVPGYTVAS